MQKFVYIVSSPHGGSTLLSHVLGKHPQALNLGEVSFVPKLLAMGELCSCGSALRECEFWGAIVSRGAGGFCRFCRFFQGWEAVRAGRWGEGVRAKWRIPVRRAGGPLKN